jgi:hypothetical protein
MLSTGIQAVATLTFEGGNFSMTSRWTRLWAGAGLLFVAAYIVILAVNGDSPDDTDSNQKIVSWYGSHSHQVGQLVAFFAAVAGAFAFIWFLAHLRSLVRQASDGDGRLAAVVFASGAVFISVFTVMVAIFTAPAFAKLDASDQFTLNPDTFRLVSAMGGLAFVAAYILVAPLAFSVGAVAWKTGMLPRWLAVASFVAGVAALASAVWFPTWLVMIWFLLLSGYLTFRPFGARTRLVSATAAA